VLFCKPAAVPVTFTEKVQELLAGIVPPDKLLTLVPCVAVIVPAPQVPLSPLGVEITRPAGSVSLKATPLRATVVLLFWMVKVKLGERFKGIEAAPNALLMVGGATTVIEAFDVLPVPPLVDVTCTLLFFAPAVVPCTFSETVQFEFGATEAPDKLTVEDPSAAVAVPPLQLVVTLLGVAATRPAGRLSVKATPVSVRFWLLLLSMVKVRLVVAFSGIVAAPKALTMCGGLMTVRSGFVWAVLPLPASVESIWTVLW